MSEPINLANPDFEPSDAQLKELASRAFAGVRAARENALREVRLRIQVGRREAMNSLSEARARL